MQTQNLIVTAILNDRVGIIRDLTGALYKSGANLTAVNQSVINGVFVISAVCEFGTPVEPEDIRNRIATTLPEKNVSIAATPCEASSLTSTGERYVAAFQGPDAPGRIFRITDIFANHNVNVEGWRHDITIPERTLTIGVVTIPAECDVHKLRADLEREFSYEPIAVSLLHENIFRATNEVGPISLLLNKALQGVSRNA